MPRAKRGVPRQKEPARRSGPTGEARHHCLGGERRMGRLHRKLPVLEQVHAGSLRGWGSSAEATGGEKPFAHLREIRHFLCRLVVARQLLCGLRA